MFWFSDIYKLFDIQLNYNFNPSLSAKIWKSGSRPRESEGVLWIRRPPLRACSHKVVSVFTKPHPSNGVRLPGCSPLCKGLAGKAKGTAPKGSESLTDEKCLSLRGLDIKIHLGNGISGPNWGVIFLIYRRRTGRELSSGSSFVLWMILRKCEISSKFCQWLCYCRLMS